MKGGHSDPFLLLLKQEINLPCDSYPPHARRERDILITTPQIQGGEGCINKPVTSLLSYYPKPKPFCPVNTNLLFLCLKAARFSHFFESHISMRSCM